MNDVFDNNYPLGDGCGGSGSSGGSNWEVIVCWDVLPERHCGELAILLCADPTAETAAESERSLPPISDVSETSTRLKGRKGYFGTKAKFCLLV